ncbi:MAG: hypothetical protein K2Q12_03005 [Rickettsiales bacterium]|nr:hypothetical protein [Rickettsiales bacterium]
MAPRLPGIQEAAEALSSSGVELIQSRVDSNGQPPRTGGFAIQPDGRPARTGGIRLQADIPQTCRPPHPSVIGNRPDCSPTIDFGNEPLDPGMSAAQPPRRPTQEELILGVCSANPAACGNLPSPHTPGLWNPPGRGGAQSGNGQVNIGGGRW